MNFVVRIVKLKIAGFALKGHSFGGYSTLAGLAFTLDLFQVGIAGAPPSDIGRSAKYYYKFKQKLGEENNDYLLKQLVVDWDNKNLADHLGGKLQALDSKKDM